MRRRKAIIHPYWQDTQKWELSAHWLELSYFVADLTIMNVIKIVISCWSSSQFELESIIELSGKGVWVGIEPDSDPIDLLCYGWTGNETTQLWLFRECQVSVEIWLQLIQLLLQYTYVHSTTAVTEANRHFRPFARSTTFILIVEIQSKWRFSPTQYIVISKWQIIS